MSTQTTTTTAACPTTQANDRQPIAFTRWQCNGSIDPLITTFEHLAEVAGDDLPEALRWMRIHLTCYHFFTEAEAAAFSERELFDAFRVSRLGHRKEILPGIFTTAQFLAKHGGTDSQAACRDLGDLLACFRLMGSYNGFDVDEAATAFQRFNRARFHNDGNPNNGSDLCGYKFGWEGSHVVYITMSNYNGKSRVVSKDGRHSEPFTVADFHHACQKLARESGADESSDYTEGGNERLVWRLWWD